ncbi:unnamed protein product [Urochloa decumbens]|uniref:SprT-like domain-containing protein n=1 Tax=Urochloa decumbens TaxID=240449 RepID=A0ABC9EXE1_9POAL
MAMADVVEEADLTDPNPDIEELFRHYDLLYFQGALAGAGFTVKWGSCSTLGSSSFGSCTFSRPQNTITLSEPVLQYLPCADRKNALLHLMIHAIIYIKHHRADRCQHGPLFRDWMDAINSCSLKDHQRPDGGYNITTRHDFSPEEPRSFKGILWKCESCGDTLLRATNLGPPTDACCIENVNMGASCGNMLCHWHNHKNDCCGTYEKGAFEKMMLESGSPSKTKVPGGAQLLLTSSSDMFKTKGAIQESGSSALQGNTKATKPNAEDKHLSLVSGSNGKPQGSSSSTKAGKRRSPEVVPETGIMRAQSPRKSKGKQDVSADSSLLSLVSGTIAKSPRSSTSKKVVKAAKHYKPEDVQKPSSLPASPQGKPNQKHGLIAAEKQELLSVEGNDAISPGSDTSKKAGKQHDPDDVQKPSVLPSAPLGTTKLHHASIATEKDKLSSAEGYNDAKPQGRKTSRRAGERHEPQIAQKACSTPAYPQKRLKQDFHELEKKELSPATGCSNEKILDNRFSKKEHRQHEPEHFKRTTILPAALGSKQKASGFVASEKQRKGKCKTKPAREKEYVVMCAWSDIYESDRSSGSTEPLVNKRTERRRRERERRIERERERILTYSRSKKNPASLIYSRTDASVRNHRIKTLPCKDEPKQQSQSPPPCSETAVSTTAADQAVATQATGRDHSQPSSPCLDIVPLQPAAPPGLAPPDQNTAGDVIDISDDD